MSDALFLRAVTNVLVSEGGRVDHPADPGGRTNLGVTQKTFDAWRDTRSLPREDVWSITRDEAVEIYRERYWHPLPAGLADDVRFMAFDAAVNHGLGRALAWLKEHDTLEAFLAHRLRFYTSLTETWPHFGRGWMRRVAHVLDGIAALELSTEPAALPAESVPVAPVRLGDFETLVMHDASFEDVLALVDAKLAGERSIALGAAVASVTGPGHRKLDVRLVE
jgi:lysozyme family protein